MANGTDERDGIREAIAIGLSFAAVAALGLLDLIGDLAEGAATWHVAVEAGASSIGLAGVALAGRRLHRLRMAAQGEKARADSAEERADGLAADLTRTKADAARWQAEAHALITGLAGAIDAQLERWGLTPAEKDIALLLLKGLSHKEIAELRATSETTVRQQSRAIYKKAGLGGRADLAAFFLEDLLSGTRPAD